jgi:hypothetical protein
MKKLIIIFITLLAIKSFGQGTSDYVILTFVSETKGGMHPSRTDHWIAKTDSISEVNYSIPLYPTYLNIEYSSDCLNDCCENKKIDLLTSTTKTKYDFAKQHEKEQKSLLKIVNENKILIQKIRLNWTGYKLKKTIKVYATPINGIFCECGIYGTSLKFANGKKKVFIPNNNFSLIENFWKSEIGKFVKWYDYSKIQPQNYH